MIQIYTICYNEEIILQKFIDHYRLRFPSCEITIYDNMSTDNSRQIAIKNGCKIIDYDSNNEVRNDLYLDIKQFIAHELQIAFERGREAEKINTGRIKKRQYENGYKKALQKQKQDIRLKIASYSNLSLEQTEDLLKLIDEL